MFVVLVGSVLTTSCSCATLSGAPATSGSLFQLALWLWFTVLFANFAEAMAEGRGKAQADALRKTGRQTRAKRLQGSGAITLEFETVSATELRTGDLVLCRAGRPHPRRRRGHRGRRLGGRVGHHRRVGARDPRVRRRPLGRHRRHQGAVRLARRPRSPPNPGETFLDRMIALVEGASRQKTPNEIALTILLSGLTIVFLLAVATLQPFAVYSGGAVAVPILDRAAGLPHSDDDRRAALGHRHRGHGPVIQQNVIAMSGRAVEAAGDVNTLLLDKTGTITLGNRQAVEFLPRGRRRARGAGRPGPARVAARRDAGRPEHRGPGQGEVRPARPPPGARRRGRAHDVRSLLGRRRG